MHSDVTIKMQVGLSLAGLPCMCSFYSAAEPHWSQCRALYTADLSVCPSVTYWCFVYRNEHTIVLYSETRSSMTLVSGDVKRQQEEYCRSVRTLRQYCRCVLRTFR